MAKLYTRSDSQVDRAVDRAWLMWGALGSILSQVKHFVIAISTANSWHHSDIKIELWHQRMDAASIRCRHSSLRHCGKFKQAISRNPSKWATLTVHFFHPLLGQFLRLKFLHRALVNLVRMTQCVGKLDEHVFAGSHHCCGRWAEQ